MIHSSAKEYDGQPCRHMVTLVSAYADGALRGFARWYTRLHIQGCPRCQAAMKALAALKDRLIRLRAPSPTESAGISDARWSQLEEQWSRLESKEENTS
jgi:anti-sigma factor RsiW